MRYYGTRFQYKTCHLCGKQVLRHKFVMIEYQNPKGWARTYRFCGECGAPFAQAIAQMQGRVQP